MIGTGSKETFLGEDDLRAIVKKAGRKFRCPANGCW
jgi:hypothetical protein